jgi:hypothetical protein
MKTTRFLALAAPLIALASCSRMTTSQPAPVSAAEKESAAEAKLCQDMTAKSSAISEFPTVTEETSLDAIKQANQQVESAVRDVQGYSQQINNPGVLEVQAAYNELQDAVNAVPGGRETVGENAIQVSQEASQLQSAWNQLYTSMQCGA